MPEVLLAFAHLYSEKTYIDSNALLYSSIQYYRLKLLAKDGSISYSNVLEFGGNDSKLQINVQPNPISNNHVNITVISPQTENAHLIVLNHLGLPVKTEEITLLKGKISKLIDINWIPAGVYSIIINTGLRNVQASFLKL